MIVATATDYSAASATLCTMKVSTATEVGSSLQAGSVLKDSRRYMGHVLSDEAKRG